MSLSVNETYTSISYCMIINRHMYINANLKYVISLISSVDKCYVNDKLSNNNTID